MDIREIRIDNFGTWDRVRIPGISPGLNVIHLSDGGQAEEFAEFTEGVLLGFPAGSESDIQSGSLVCRLGQEDWTLSRTREAAGPGRWKLSLDERIPENPSKVMQRILAGLPVEVIRRIFLGSPMGASIRHRWRAINDHPELADWIFDHQPHPWIQQVSHLSLTAHGRVIEELGEERENLGRQLKATLEQPRETVPQTSPNEALLADLTDEARHLRHQLAPVQAAAELAPLQAEIRSLEKQIGETNEDAQTYEPLLREYQRLQAELKDRKKRLRELEHQGQQDRSRNPKSSGAPSKVKQLLKHRKRVLALVSPSKTHAETEPRFHRFDDQAQEEILHAGNLVEAASREFARVSRRLSGVSTASAFRRTTVQQSKSGTHASSAVSPNETELRSQRDELKRRRLWVREEVSYLVRRQMMAGPFLLCLTLLFSLGISCLFGVLLVESQSAQWALTFIGLGSITATGALKIAIDNKDKRQLRNCQNRLVQLDDAIDSLAVTSNTSDAKTEQHVVDREIHLQLVESQRRVDSAEATFRDALSAHGLRTSLTPSQAMSALRRSPNRFEEFAGNRGSLSDKDAERLARWIRQAREICHEVDGVRPTEDVRELIAHLERLQVKLRTKSHRRLRTGELLDKDQIRQEIRDEKRSIRQLESRQREILTEAAAEDEFTLAAVVESSQKSGPRKRRLAKLQNEIELAVETLEDGEEIRELLAKCSKTELDSMRGGLDERIKAIEHEIQDLNAMPTVQATVATDDQRDADCLRLRLSQIETRMRHALQNAQVATVLRGIASRMAETQRSPVESLLSRMSAGKWNSLTRNDQNELQLAGPNSAGRPIQQCSEKELECAWLAVQFAAVEALISKGNTVPLLIPADWLVSDQEQAKRLFPIAAEAAARGQQLLLVTDSRTTAQRMVKLGVPVVDVSLKAIPTSHPDLAIGRTQKPKPQRPSAPPFVPYLESV